MVVQYCNSEGEVIHILKDKSTITESQLVTSIINDEITKLQTNNKVSKTGVGSKFNHFDIFS